MNACSSFLPLALRSAGGSGVFWYPSFPMVSCIASSLSESISSLSCIFRGRRAASITPDLALRYITERQATKTHLGGLTSNATINRELALLRRMLRLAARPRKGLRGPPVARPKEGPPGARLLEGG